MGNSVDKLGMVFDSLANEVRRGIIDSLAYNPATISELAKEFKISLPGMNKHLTFLEKADLIRRQKVGRSNIIAINSDSLQIAQVWINRYQTHWGSRRETLENYVSRINSNSDLKSLHTAKVNKLKQAQL